MAWVPALLAVYFIWGSTYLAIRVAVHDIAPFLMLSGRFVIAGLLLYGWLRARGAANPGWRQWLSSAAVGGLLLGGGNGGVGFAEQSVPSGLAALVIGTTPLWMAVFGAFWGRRPRWLEVAALAIGIAGVALLNAKGPLGAHPLPTLVLLFSAVFWAFGSVWSKALPMPGGAMSSALEMITGGGVLLVISLIRGEHLPHAVSSGAWLAVAYLIVVGSLVGFSAYLYLLETVRPALATSYAYVNPVVAVALGVVLAGEAFTARIGIALLVILSSVVLVVLASQRST